MIRYNLGIDSSRSKVELLKCETFGKEKETCKSNSIDVLNVPPHTWYYRSDIRKLSVKCSSHVLYSFLCLKQEEISIKA